MLQNHAGNPLELEAYHEIQPGGYATKFFDFTAPKKSALATEAKDRKHGGSQFEQFDYLGSKAPLTRVTATPACGLRSIRPSTKSTSLKAICAASAPAYGSISRAIHARTLTPNILPPVWIIWSTPTPWRRFRARARISTLKSG